MKKIFLFVAAVAAAMTMNAQEKVFAQITDYANYIEFQALMADPAIKGATISSTTPLELPNGSVLKGFQKSDGSEAECKWNAKDAYNTNWFVADGMSGVDSLTVGTQWRAASGCSLEFGAFEVTENGKVYIYYQLNGDDSKKSGTDVRGVSLAILSDDPVEYRYATGKNCCVAQFAINAGVYDKGEVVMKVLKNTINIAGIRIDNYKEVSQGIEDVNDAVKAVKFFENGQLVIMKNGVKYNALGAQL